jgi:8-amino-7-oxononanoate synthase
MPSEFHNFLKTKLDIRKEQGGHRVLNIYDDLIDFSSNDYLGIAAQNMSGSGGSRLISGNTKELIDLEKNFAEFIGAEAALFFASGYLANIGVIPAVCDRNTTIFYDELIHASLRDGIRLSNAKSYSFKHNNIEDLKVQLSKYSGKKLIVTEVVFSMDGDSPDFDTLFKVAKESKAELLIDEAHSFGIVGSKGVGFISENNKIDSCLCTIYPLGKALGLSGCLVAGSQLMIDFLINFSRSFIYSTGPSKQHVLQLNKQLHDLADKSSNSIFELKNYFIEKLNDKCSFITGPNSTIISVIIPGNENVKSIEKELLDNGFFIKAILYPTVAKGSERLRICIHDFNSESQLTRLAELLNNLI